MLRSETKSGFDLEVVGRQMREVIACETAAIAKLDSRIDDEALRAMDLLLASTGRIIVTGMGKMGAVAR